MNLYLAFRLLYFRVMSFHLMFSQLARYGDQATVGAGAFINRHIVIPGHCSRYRQGNVA